MTYFPSAFTCTGPDADTDVTPTSGLGGATANSMSWPEPVSCPQTVRYPGAMVSPGRRDTDCYEVVIVQPDGVMTTASDQLTLLIVAIVLVGNATDRSMPPSVFLLLL